jgi:hypothetical protein
MKTHFTKRFNGIDFLFERVMIRKNVWYEVQFNNNGNKATFKMYMDTDGGWYIVKQELPEWIKEMEMEFSESIITNEHS